MRQLEISSQEINLSSCLHAQGATTSKVAAATAAEVRHSTVFPKEGGVKPGTAIVESLRTGGNMVLQAALTLPEGLVGFLPPEPTAILQAQASPEWPHWKGAMEVDMNGRIANGIWDQ